MNAYVLIVILFANGSSLDEGPFNTVSMQEFKSKESCVQAQQIIVKNTKNVKFTQCVPS